MIVAAAKAGLSGQQIVGSLILAAMALVLGGFILLTMLRRDPGVPVGAEVEIAANRKPYYDDDVLEGPRLDRALLFSFAMIMVIAIGLPLYWLFEPARQAGALNGFDIRSADRGKGLFTSSHVPGTPESPLHAGCADCHGGMNASGGSASYVISDPANPKTPPHTVSWSAPPLNTVLYRFKEDDTASPPIQELKQIIVYGRAGTPMPAWGINGGGPLDDQQIGDLIAYIQSIQLSPADAKKYWADKAKSTAISEGSVDAAGNPIITGKVLFDTNCARCHTKGYSYGEPQQAGGGGQYAPNLTGGSELRQFPSITDQVTFVSQGVDPGKGYGTGGIMTDYGGGMPHFGVSQIGGKQVPGYLTQDEITAIVEYERSL